MLLVYTTYGSILTDQVDGLPAVFQRGMFMELQITWWFVPYSNGSNAGSWFGNHVFDIEDNPDKALLSWLTSYYAEILGPQLADQLDRELSRPSAEIISRVISIAAAYGKDPPPEALAYEVAARNFLDAWSVSTGAVSQASETARGST